MIAITSQIKNNIRILLFKISLSMMKQDVLHFMVSYPAKILKPDQYLGHTLTKM